jgi:hypothetical protein
MPFQFYCPQGHLLEGHESQMGQQSQCPLCGILFIIPVIQSGAAPAGWSPAAPGPWPEAGAAEPATEAPPEINVVPPPPGSEAAAPAGQEADPPDVQAEVATEEPQEPAVLHVPCPQGHVLETPADMIGQEVLCPFCQTQFRLRREDSVEYREEQALARRLREERFNKAVLKWSIVAAAVVVLAIVTMIVLAAR